VLECSLQTRSNITIVSEEVAQKGQNLEDVVKYISDIVALRSEKKKNFGTVLIPEGLLQHLPLFRQLIEELN
jgi:diphosphate--fructose-6-phosphate 1-phosphotransferase